MNHHLVKRLSSAGAVLLLLACDSEKKTNNSTDPLRRQYSLTEFANLSEQTGVTRQCSNDRRRGGMTLVNNGETLVVANCAGVLTSFATAGDLAKSGQLSLGTLPTSAFAQAIAEATARGIAVSPPEVKRITNIGASQVLVVHQAGYDVVDFTASAAPTLVSSQLVLRSAATTAVKTLNRVQDPGTTASDRYTLVEGRLLSPYPIENGCVLQDRFAIVTLAGWQTRERDSVMTMRVNDQDPLTIGGALVYDIASGGQVSHLAASQFGPRGCEANDSGVVMFSDEEDSGIYPYTVDIFVQLGFREYFGAVFERVAEVFGTSVEKGGGGLGNVIAAVTESGTIAGEGVGEPIAAAAISAALEEKLAGSAADAGGAVAGLYTYSDLAGCSEPEATAILEIVNACVVQRVGLIDVDKADPEDVLTEIESAAAESAGLIAAGSGCSAGIVLTCVGGAVPDFLGEVGANTGEVLQGLLFSPVFTLPAGDVVNAFRDAVPDGAPVPGPANIAADFELPGTCDSVAIAAGDITTIRSGVKTCATTFFSSYTPTSQSVALDVRGSDPGELGFELFMMAECAKVAVNTTLATDCTSGELDDIADSVISNGATQALLAVYTKFGLLVATEIAEKLGELVGGAAIRAEDVPVVTSVPEASGTFSSYAGLVFPAVAGYITDSSAAPGIQAAVQVAAGSSTAANEQYVGAQDLVFRKLVADAEVWNAGPLRSMMWDEAGLTSRDDIDAVNYTAFNAKPPAGDDFLNRYTFDLVHPQRGAKYVKVFGSRFTSSDAEVDASLKGIRALSYTMAASECFDLNKQWNAPRALSDGPMRAGGPKPTVPALLNPQNLRTGGTLTEDLENPDVVVPLYKWDDGSSTWGAGAGPADGGDGSDGFMGPIVALHKVAWDTWVDRNADIATPDKAAVKALVGAVPQLNEAIDPAFACSDPADFSNPNFTCMLCQPRFVDLVSLKLDTSTADNPNAKVACQIEYGDKRIAVAPSCAGRAPGSKPRPVQFTNGNTSIDGDALSVDPSDNKLVVTPSGGSPIDAEWDCTCEGDVSSLQCDADGNIVCLANSSFEIVVKSSGEAPAEYSELSDYLAVANQLSMGVFGKMHLVDLSVLANGVSIGQPQPPPTFDDLQPANAPSSWNLSSRLVRKGRPIATEANPIRVDDQFGTSSDELVIQSRLFTNGVDVMAPMPGQRYFFGIEGPEGWDLFDTKDFGPRCELTSNPEFKSSCFHNAQHFGFVITPAAESFLSGTVTDEEAERLVSALYRFDQKPLPTLSAPFVGVNAGGGVGVDERTLVMVEGQTLGGNVWIYDVQGLADGTGAPTEVYKEVLLPGFSLAQVAADAASRQIFVIATKRDEGGTDNDVRILRLTGDVPFGVTP